MRTIIVKHPKYGSYRAEHARDKLQAVIGAAKKWGVQWSAIARECEFEEGGADSEHL